MPDIWKIVTLDPEPLKSLTEIVLLLSSTNLVDSNKQTKIWLTFHELWCQCQLCSQRSWDAIHRCSAFAFSESVLKSGLVSYGNICMCFIRVFLSQTLAISFTLFDIQSAKNGTLDFSLSVVGFSLATNESASRLNSWKMVRGNRVMLTFQNMVRPGSSGKREWFSS